MHSVLTGIFMSSPCPCKPRFNICPPGSEVKLVKSHWNSYENLLAINRSAGQWKIAQSNVLIWSVIISFKLNSGTVPQPVLTSRQALQTQHFPHAFCDMKQKCTTYVQFNCLERIIIYYYYYYTLILRLLTYILLPLEGDPVYIHTHKVFFEFSCFVFSCFAHFRIDCSIKSNFQNIIKQ